MHDSQVDVVRVFVDEQGRFGNPLAICVKAGDRDDAECTRIAQCTGTSETVFVDAFNPVTVRIFVPGGRIPFAGYPLVGLAWYLQQRGVGATAITTDRGVVPCGASAHTAWIRTVAGRGLPWLLLQRDTPKDVDLASSKGPDRHDYVWAWSDETDGFIRARAFTSASGTAEDEATGSAAIELAAHLGRAITITQGLGSVITVQPVGDEYQLQGNVRRSASVQL